MIRIVGAGIGKFDANLQTDPRYRKATHNMFLTQAAVEAALAPFLAADLDMRDMGLVLGSSHGELDMTLNFLKTLAETGAARPLLFQNSLHNSTTGFVAMNCHITGPMLTISNLHHTGEDTLNTAALLLRDGSCKFCLAVGVDTCFPDLGIGLSMTGMNAPGRREGAAALLLTTTDKLSTLGHLGQITLSARDKTSLPPPPQSHYDSDAIEHLVVALRDAAQTSQPLRLLKMDGSTTEIEWSL